MLASDITRNATIGGRRVDRTAPAVRHGRPMIRVTFTDGTSALYGRNETVATSRRVEIPAGPVAPGWFCAAAPKHRASSGIWRGEGDGTQREMRMIARVAAFGTR